ncbi:hypothetical protein [Paracidovorax anthurii]|uniref:hypothetical protein n=1 Tax=Paracidovorax anthurii TaxID=78229 RepID=UPI0011BDCC2D|nr:hypothetical protein [Paracidovorax anthurii]
MLVISRARRIGLSEYQHLWLEAMEHYSQPQRAGTVIILDEFIKSDRRRVAAHAARCCRPMLHRVSALVRKAA